MIQTALTFLAATTPDDVFKSMSDSSSSVETNPAQVLAILAAIVGVVVLVSVFKKRADRPAKSGELNSPSRLTRQLAREAGLTRREIKELKTLAQLQGVEHPLTLLLCPSLMQAAIEKRRAAKA